MKNRTIEAVCACGHKTLFVIHGKPSERVFIICPDCMRKTPIKPTEGEAKAAWEAGEIIKHKER